MTGAEGKFEDIATRLQAGKEAVQRKLFGKPCLKINRKAFVWFFEQCMPFELCRTFHKEAMELAHPGYSILQVQTVRWKNGCSFLSTIPINGNILQMKPWIL